MASGSLKIVKVARKSTGIFAAAGTSHGFFPLPTWVQTYHLIISLDLRFWRRYTKTVRDLITGLSCPQNPQNDPLKFLFLNCLLLFFLQTYFSLTYRCEMSIFDQPKSKFFSGGGRAVDVLSASRTAVSSARKPIPHIMVSPSFCYHCLKSPT